MNTLYKTNCFFCNPDRRRIVQESSNFYAILGLGPIVEGYTVIASKQHHKSTLDLPDALLNEQINFSLSTRDVLARIYGPSIVVEHGRIKACTSLEVDPHEDHCFHAHQLIFPVSVDLLPLLEFFGYPAKQFSSLSDARRSVDPKNEYLLFQDSGGNLNLAEVPHPCRRQFMRYLVGLELGHEQLADWRRFEGWPEIWHAKTKFENSFNDQSRARYSYISR